MSYHRSNLVFNLLFWVYEFFYRIIVHLFPIERRSLLLNGRSGFCLIKRVLILAFFLYTIYILIERLSFFFPLQIIDLKLESRTCKYYIVKPDNFFIFFLYCSSDTIFVRVFESRMDLLRAVIIGAEGTPYQDGLFFFDVSFPSGYPNVPPVRGWGYFI
jgi:hypothetical protein